MSHFVMLMGIPGSGKSTIAENIALKDSAILISTDKIRRELTGSETDFSMDGQVFKTALHRVQEFLNNKMNVVYDATNLTREERRKVLKVIPQGTNKTCVFRKVSPAIAIKRNLKRKRVVPEEIIAKMARKIKEPSPDEGWDEIKIIEN